MPLSGPTSSSPHARRVGFRAVNDFAQETAWLHGAARLFANDGVFLFGLLLVLGLLLNRAVSLRAVARSILAGAGVLVAVAVNQPLVHGIAEQRPYRHWHDVLVLVHRKQRRELPSDHAVMAGAVLQCDVRLQTETRVGHATRLHR